MRPRTRRVVASLGVLVASLALASSAAQVGAEVVTPGQRDTAPAAPTDDERQLGSDLGALVDAWAEGGGRFGYPFWEKAGQRWRLKQVTATMYREYVTGYRDSLVAGCPLVRDVELDSAEAREVRDLLVEACEHRLDGLRAQQRWLDELIRRDGSEPDPDATAAEERITERDEQATTALQESWLATRRAMNAAQAALDEAGVDRLPEDAFL